MSDKWYSKLITSVREVYSDRIIVSDPDILSEAEEIREALAVDFVLHTYRSEIALRAFISKSAGKRMVIFNPPRSKLHSLKNLSQRKRLKRE